MSASVAVASGPLMTGDVPLGEAIAFWILGPLSLAGGIGMVLFRNAVHSALSLAGTMMCLGAMYIVEQGPFIGLVQIIVYTGAIMILFLFVLMLVGRDSSDSLVEVLRGQRWAALLGGIAFALLVALTLGRSFTDTTPANLQTANSGGTNVNSLAALIFTKYLFAFELTSALLIVAAVGAMISPTSSATAQSQRRKPPRASGSAPVGPSRYRAPGCSPRYRHRHSGAAA